MTSLLARRNAARALIALAKKNQREESWQGAQAAADAHLEELQKLVQAALEAGRAEIDREKLVSAITYRSEHAVYIFMNNAIVELQRVLGDSLEAVLLNIIVDSAKAAESLVQKYGPMLRVSAKQPPVSTTQMAFDETNPKAVETARKRAAELIQGISEGMRERLRELVEEAFTQQIEVDDLADQIEEIIGDAARAETIARTETMKASNDGQQLLWEEAAEKGLLTGLEKKEWIVTPDDRLCPVCEPMDGVQVELGGFFSVGGEQLEGPPAHPNCRCTIGLAV